jgi:H+/gluconate symporter-like permease
LTHKYIIIPVFIVAFFFIFCQVLLVDVRDKLLFEQEYAGSIREKVPPRSSLHIPWSWLPAALCVLQEVTQMLLLKNQNIHPNH